MGDKRNDERRGGKADKERRRRGDASREVQIRRRECCPIELGGGKDASPKIEDGKAGIPFILGPACKCKFAADCCQIKKRKHPDSINLLSLR